MGVAYKNLFSECFGVISFETDAEPFREKKSKVRVRTDQINEKSNSTLIMGLKNLGKIIFLLQ